MSGDKHDNTAFRNWAYGLLTSLLFLELFLFAWCRVQCVQRGFEISEAQAYAEKLAAQQTELKVKLEHLKNPERITRIARERFGLVHPDPGQIFWHSSASKEEPAKK